MRRSMLTAAGALIVAAVAPDAAAQSLGAIRWQLAPYCNVLTLDVIQEGGVYRLQGYDDQCGRTGGMWSVVSGTAVLAPGNAARLGLTYTFPGGAITEGALIRATIDLGTFSGTWDDNGSHSGAFVFAPSGGSGGPLRDPATPSNGFVHRVTTSNRPAVSSGASNITCFSHPLTDGNPNALILAVVNIGVHSTSGITPVPTSYSVYYDNNGTPLPPPLNNDVWCISRDDSQTMPLGVGFNIRVIAP